MKKAATGYLLAALAAFLFLRPRTAQAAFMPTGSGTSDDQSERAPALVNEGLPLDVIFDPMMEANFMTPHFTLEEFTASRTALSKGIDNSLPDNLQDAAQNTLAMMERIRAFLSTQAGHDVPIFISSGYRSPALNAAVSGTVMSDHTSASAVDWSAPSFGTPYKIAMALASDLDNLGIGQLINEFPDGQGWVHTSTNSPLRAINKIITVARSGTVPGIVKG